MVGANVGPKGKFGNEHGKGNANGDGRGADVGANVGPLGNGNGKCNGDGLGNSISNSNGIRLSDEHFPKCIAIATHDNHRLSDNLFSQID